MRIKPLFLTAIIAAGLFAVGCGAQGGKTIYTQGANAEPVMGKAPQDGTYQLYTAMSPNPTTTVKLSEGEPLGFRRTSDGKMEGVAGDQGTVLPKGTVQAYWKMKKN